MHDSSKVGQRIVVVGVTGSGKTTLAAQLSACLDLPHTELDSVYWGPDWTETPRDVFRQRVSGALTGERWIVDGNYSKVQDIVWERADTLIWLDYGLPLILWRLTRRGIGRVTRQELLWNENRETWRGLFFSRDSLFLWALKTYGRRRRQYPQLLNDPAYSHLIVFRFLSPKETNRWLTEVERGVTNI